MQNFCEFNIIMPTYNRAFCIENALNSLLQQTYTDFGLIIVDDGSTDGTEDLVRTKFKKELETGRFLYLKQPHSGVCRARNLALYHTNCSWIAYLDTDNELMPDFLETFHKAILKHKKTKCFYAQAKTAKSGIIGKKFNLKQLLQNNYIDLGVFVHHKSLVEKYGAFDTNLKRVVDWDLIIRYTAFEKPVFVEKPLLKYNDSNDFNRISNSEDPDVWVKYVQDKAKNIPCGLFGRLQTFIKNHIKNVF